MPQSLQWTDTYPNLNPVVTLPFSKPQSIASRITAALSVDVSTAVSNAAAAVRGFTANVNAHASGTLSAEPGIALVGEEGPELVRFKGGETVYTADETEQIISGYADNHFSIPPV